MPRKRTIAPRTCKILYEESTPDSPSATAPENFPLPPSFPADLLTDDQLEAAETWWHNWVEDTLHTLRQALTCARTRSAKADAAHPVNLQNLIVHAVTLAHLLRLHPSAEDELYILGKKIGVSERRMYYARDAILSQLGTAAIRACTRRPTPRNALANLRDLLADYKQLDTAHLTTPKTGTVLIPYATRCPMAQRYAIMQRLALLPGVASVRDDLTPDDRPAITINLK